MLTYAVGDIHGCLSLLVDLLRRIEDDARGRGRRIVFLGDYIDRGPDSAGTVRLLRELRAREPDAIVCLKGNHEDLCLRAAADPDQLENWLVNGGRATLRSFDVDVVAELPRDVLGWMATLPTAWEDERRCFVHAGLSPDRDRAGQTDHDRMWIRDAFLGSTKDFGRFVVHGHTPCAEGVPDLRAHRVNLDTAAVFGGPLTAAVFTDERDPPVAFLTARRPASTPAR